MLLFEYLATRSRLNETLGICYVRYVKSHVEIYFALCFVFRRVYFGQMFGQQSGRTIGLMDGLRFS